MKDFWQKLNYLNKGSKRQQKAYKAIESSNVMEILKAFDPILVGTIPLEIDLPDSDLDIICEVYDPKLFINIITTHFGREKDFHIQQKEIRHKKVSLARFCHKNFEFELFGQAVPVMQQYAYRHMLIEHKLLHLKGDVFREKIIALKKSGLKTEPAFAKALNLQGNPYEALLKFNEFKIDN